MQVISDQSLFHPQPNAFSWYSCASITVYCVHLLNLNLSDAQLHAESDVWGTPKLVCDLVLYLFDILELKK